MDENVLELEQFEATSFMGISSQSPVVIDFTSRKNNQNVVEFFGDQGLCKTSTLCGILYAMGASFGLDKKKLLNTTDKAIDINLKFTYNDEQYHVVANSSRTDLKKLNESGKWKSEDSPIAMLKKIFGPVSLSPFNVREMKGKDQIQFFQDMFGSGEDASKKMKKIEAELDTVFNSRTDINREVKALTNSLEIEPLYQNYEKSQERFAKPVSADKEKKKFDDLAEKKTAYEKYENTLDSAKGSLKDIGAEIKELEQKLEKKKAEQASLVLSVEKGDKWLETNKSIVKEYDTANKEWLNLSITLAEYEKWKTILKKEQELFQQQELAIEKTGEVDKLREQLLKLTKSCVPKVEGLSIKVAAGLDKAAQQEGVFFNNQGLHELSESEYVALWCQIFEAAGVNFIFLENTTSFGSKATSIFNELSKNGATIFATRMDKKIKKMGVTFKSKIE